MFSIGEIKAEVKPVPTLFITLPEVDTQFEVHDILKAVNEMLCDTSENSDYGSDCLRDYELQGSTIAHHALLSLGLTRMYIGPNMARCYCIAEGKTSELQGLQDKLYELIASYDM